MSRMEFVDLGPGTVKRVTARAVLIALDDHEEQHWFPLSTLSTETAAQCEEGVSIDRVRVETWIARDRELVE